MKGFQSDHNVFQSCIRGLATSDVLFPYSLHFLGFLSEPVNQVYFTCGCFSCEKHSALHVYIGLKNEIDEAEFACGCPVPSRATAFSDQERTSRPLNPMLHYAKPRTLIVSTPRNLFGGLGTNHKFVFRRLSIAASLFHGNTLVVVLNPVLQSLESPLAIRRTGQA